MNRDKIEQSQINNAVKKPVDNLLLYVLVIDRQTMTIKDIVRKPGLCNKDLTDFPQFNATEEDMVSVLRLKGYTVEEPKN